MVAVSLLQRLDSDESVAATGADASSDSAVMGSILANLRTILNSRQGCCETRIDFGLSDFNSISENFRNSISLVAAEVEQQIRTFEPRLKNVFVRAVEDKARPLDLIFHIDAELNDKDRTLRISIDSFLGSDGRVRINE